LNGASRIQGHGGYICSMFKQEPASIKGGFDRCKIWYR
jgi:hypothetical protein